MTEHRRLGGVDRERPNLRRLDSAQNREQTVEVHRFVQAVVDRFAHEHMVGDADRSAEVFAAGGGIRKARGEQIVGAHPLQLRRDFLARAHAQDRERPGRVPAPARAEHRRRQHGLGERRFGTGRLEILEHDLERKGVLLGQRKDDAVVGRRRL